MNRAQGNTRQAPDGFLHIQNFTVTKHSGMAGFLYAKVMTPAQQEIVELCLIQKFTTNGYCNGSKGTWSEAHGCHRFPKGFLQAQFKPTVYSVFKALDKSPQSIASSLITGEQHEALKFSR